MRRSALTLALTIALGVAAALLWVGPGVQAFIPKADRTIEAIARVNRSSGRSQALQLELTMRIGDRDPIARGQLISHPSGLARLELRGVGGRVDRYLLSGAELSAAKDGFRLAHPQPMLQPIFFLQPSTETTLRAALESFDVLIDSIGLAPCGEQDCFVIGDPRLAAPLPAPPPDEFASGDEDVLGDPLAEPLDGYAVATTHPTTHPTTDPKDEGAAGPEERIPEGDGSEAESGAALLAGSELVIPDDAFLPRLWVDAEDLQIRRIDRASGVFTLFGPIVAFEKLRVPAWFEVHEPGAEPIRFEVDRAVQVNAPPQAFSRKWLLAPVVTPGRPVPFSSSGPSPAGTAASPSNAIDLPH